MSSAANIAALQHKVSPVSLRRRVTDHAMTGIAILTVIVVLVPLVAIFGYLLVRGLASVNWAFLTQTPKPPGEVGGGVANGIVGSGMILGIASLLGVPLGIGAGIYLAEYGRNRLGDAVRFTADVLNGVPSIVIGIVAYAIVVLRWHFSALAGGVALALMLVPISLRTTEQFLSTVPNALREGALALGASKWKTIATVVVPAAYRGIATGMILGVARIAGETAPLLFTSGNNAYMSSGFTQPTASLPVMIFLRATAPYEDWHRQAWAAGMVLLLLVLLANIAARLILSRGIAVQK